MKFPTEISDEYILYIHPIIITEVAHNRSTLSLRLGQKWLSEYNREVNTVHTGLRGCSISRPLVSCRNVLTFFKTSFQKVPVIPKRRGLLPESKLNLGRKKRVWPCSRRLGDHNAHLLWEMWRRFHITAFIWHGLTLVTCAILTRRVHNGKWSQLYEGLKTLLQVSLDVSVSEILSLEDYLCPSICVEQILNRSDPGDGKVKSRIRV